MALPHMRSASAHASLLSMLWVAAALREERASTGEARAETFKQDQPDDALFWNAENKQLDMLFKKHSAPLLLQDDSHAVKTAGAIKLNDGHLSVFLGCERPSNVLDPRKADCLTEKAGVLLHTCTLDWHDEETQEGVALHSTCAVLTGCRDPACEAKLYRLRLCSAGKSDNLAKWKVAINAAISQCSDAAEQLPSAIQRAVHQVLSSERLSADELPSAFSPYSGRAREEVKLKALVVSFRLGLKEFLPGKNSRSGASFFVSEDEIYFAKKVRKAEFQTLWKLVHDGEYAAIYESGSLLNSIYLGLKVPRLKNRQVSDYWIIMKKETPAPLWKSDLFIRRKSFFFDTKPEPLVSDRSEAMEMLSEEEWRRSVHLESLPDWGRLKHLLDQDVQFLASKDIVDYSLLMYGDIFDVPSLGRAKSSIDRLRAATGMEPKCAFGCTKKNDRQLIDASAWFGRSNSLDYDDECYRCCCREYASPGRPPLCVMVSTRAAKRSIFGLFPQTSCPSLLGEEWRPFHAKSSTMINGGLCLIDAYYIPHTGKNHALASARQHFLQPTSLPGIQLPPPTAKASCMSVCFAIVDYLLPLDSWNQFENNMLTVVYGSRKWSDYDLKMERLMKCLGNPFGKVNHSDSFCFDHGPLIERVGFNVISEFIVHTAKQKTI